MRSVVVGYWSGLLYPFRGIRYVFVEHPGLVRFWLPPIVLTLAALVAAGVFAVRVRVAVLERFWPAPEGTEWSHVTLQWLHAAAGAIVGLFLFGLAAATIVLLTSVIAAPFNDALSQHVDAERSGFSGSGASVVRGVLHDMGRTVVLEVGKLALYASVMLPLLALSWLAPGVGTLAYSIFAFFFTAVYFALDYMDWPAARRGWPVRERARLIRRHLGAAVGFGTGVWLLLFVPLVNLLFMPAAVVGGTMLFLKLTGVGSGDRPGTK